MTPVQLAGLSAFGALVAVGMVGSAINGTKGATPVKWFRTAVFSAFIVFVMMLAIFYVPEGY